MTTTLNILKQADIFYGMTPTQLELVAKLCQERTFHAEEIILQEGATTDELFVISEGEVNILVNPALVSPHPDHKFAPKVIANLRRGQSFGEIALVDQGIRTATVQAVQEDTRLLVLPRENLLQLCKDFPELGFRLMFNLAADLALKMRNVNLMIREELV
jgi:CRP-like cAMP-binding protein